VTPREEFLAVMLLRKWQTLAVELREGKPLRILEVIRLETETNEFLTLERPEPYEVVAP
jgi:hypothetical protein